jgi:beta-xylosidase
VDKFHHGAQPIDDFVFHDDDGRHYLIYGGWRHCNSARLKEDFSGFIPFEDGETFKSIAPNGSMEGPFVFKQDGKFYFIWSEDGWTGPGYRVAYAVSASLFGPHERLGVVLQQDAAVATGAGHHSVIHNPRQQSWYIVYHRRPLGKKDGNHRVTCIDRMEFDKQGLIKPVRITFEGVAASPLH